MKCLNCGRPLEPDFKFCPECAAPTPPILLEVESQSITELDDIKGIDKTKKATLKKVFLLTMIVALSFSALLGIFVILTGNGGELEGKILGTTASIGGYSLLALCFSALFEKKKFAYLAIAGFAACLIGLVLVVLNIWVDFDYTQWKYLGMLIWTFVIVPIFMAQSSLLLLIAPKNKTVWSVLLATVSLILSVTVMILILVWELFDITGDTYYKCLAVLAILDVLGTIVTPILNKMTIPEK